MKAVVYHEHGGPEVVRYEDVPDPTIKATEVLVRVRASACNYNDIWARQGMPAVRIPFPHLPGSDLSGEVAEVGSEVTTAQVGQKVILHPGVSCRTCESCTSGHEYLCRSYKVYGFQTGPLQGAHAEYAVVPEANVVPMPPNLTFEEAAAVPLVFLTAWHMLVTRSQMKAGDDVLIWGAGGGLGTAAIQVVKVFGARAIAVAGTDEKLKMAEELGADDKINHSTQDVVAEVRRLTNRKGADIVFEHVGQDTWERSILAAAWGGKVVTCGSTTGHEAKTDLRHLFNRHLNLVGSHMGTKAELLQVMKFVERGQLKPVIQAVLPQKETAKAQQMMENRAHFGKIVLVP